MNRTIGKVYWHLQDDYVPVPKPRSPFSEGLSDDFLKKSRMEYDENLAYADSEFGRLYDAMLQQGMLDNTVVIVTADHGEMFERGIVSHLTTVLYEPLLHIPLLISVPGQNQRQDIHDNTSCVDILATLAKLTGQPLPEWGEGEVLPGFRDDPVQEQRRLFAVEAKSSPKFGPLNKASVAMIKGNYKLIYYRGYENTPAPELYALNDDPEELQDLAEKKSSIATEMQQEIEQEFNKTRPEPGFCFHGGISIRGEQVGRVSPDNDLLLAALALVDQDDFTIRCRDRDLITNPAFIDPKLDLQPGHAGGIFILFKK
jgi:arylsulfatase A-like enzyme